MDKGQGTTSEKSRRERGLLEARLAYHLRCLREDATDPTLSAQERLTRCGAG